MTKLPDTFYQAMVCDPQYGWATSDPQVSADDAIDYAVSYPGFDENMLSFRVWQIDLNDDNSPAGIVDMTQEAMTTIQKRREERGIE